MSAQLEQLVAEAKAWLASQSAEAPQSERWYAFSNLRSFVSSIEVDSSPDGIARAARALRHQIADQFDWSADYSKVISAYCERAEQIRRGLLSRQGGQQNG
jgi:hypothetical protein